MNEKIKVTKGNSFTLAIPLIEINAAGEQSPIQVDELTDLVCRVYSPCGGEYDVSMDSEENRILLQVPAPMPVGVYNVDITAKRGEQRISLRIKDCFERVEWDEQSNWRDYIVGDHIELIDHPFIVGYYNTDAELERLKEELRQSIEEANFAKRAAEETVREYEQKIASVDDIASETNATANKQTILGVLNGIATNMYKGVPVVTQTGDATISPNAWNVWESVDTALTITKGAEVSGVVNEYIIRLTCTADVAVTFSGWTLVWYGGNAPTFSAGKTYEISIIDNIALWAEF